MCESESINMDEKIACIMVQSWKICEWLKRNGYNESKMRPSPEAEPQVAEQITKRINELREEIASCKCPPVEECTGIECLDCWQQWACELIY